jgi:hypothetical protein
VVVGAYSEDSGATGVNSNQADNSAEFSGAAYVFVRSGSTWSQQAYLKASNTDYIHSFGFSVAVSGDTVAVGAYLEGSSATGVNSNQADNSAEASGAAYMFNVFNVAPQRTVRTGNASAVTDNSATLSGMVNPGGLVTTAHFEYGLTSSYGNTASVTLVPNNGSSEQIVSATIFGLQAGNTYHYRLVVAGGKELDFGDDGTFDTSKESGTFDLIFQQGANGYSSVKDTEIRSSSPDWSWPTSPYMYIYPTYPSGFQGLIRFDNIFGTGLNQILPTMAIKSASLKFTRLPLENAPHQDGTMDLHRMVANWNPSVSWATALLNGNSEAGIQKDDIEARAVATESDSGPTFDVTADIQAWHSGAENNGWALFAHSDYSWLFSSDWHGALDERPILTVNVAPQRTVRTGNASAVTGNSAILSGTVNPGGLVTTAQFEYGLTSSYGSTANVMVVPNNGSGDQIVSEIISGLQPGAIYHYRLIATNSEGDSYGSDKIFVTSKAGATIELVNLTAVYDGSGKSAAATTVPPGLDVIFTYDGSATVPTDAGTYAAVGTINDINYQGSASANLVISKATATVLLGDLTATYDGTEKSATATTTPSGLAVSFTYDGSATGPTNAGSYAVVAMVNDSNYTEVSDSGTFVIAKGVAGVDLSNLSATYDGTPKAITIATVPADLPFNVTYAGQIQPPTHAGAYPVVVTINDSNYTGVASGELVIAKGNQIITFAPIPNQTLDETTVQLSASAASGLRTIFSVVSGPASVSGNTLTIEGLGPIVVEASQAGDSNWNAASPVQRTFHVFSGTFGQDFVWAKGFGGSSSDTGYGIATDSAGNAYVASDFTGTVAFGAISLTASGSSSDLALLKVAADGNVLSATRFGGANFDYAKAVAVDTSDNVILAGEFMTSTVMGGTTLTSAGSKDISLLKVNSAGALQWSKRFGGTSSDSVYGLTTDADGNILISGDFSGSITFGTTTLTSSGGRDGFLAKLNPSGSPLWAMKIGGTGNDTAYAVTVAASGQFVVGGSFFLTASFGAISRISAGGTDGFAMGISSAGSVQWVSRFGGSSNDSTRAVAVDSTGAACVAGNFAGTDATFGTEVLASEGLDDAFVVRLDVTNGAFLTVKQCGGAGADAGLGLAADPFGSLYLSGAYSGTAYFDGNTLITPQGPDAFVAKLSVDGNFLWALAGGGAANDSATNIAVDRAGHVFVAGLFAQAARIGSHDVTGGGLVDLFVSKINGPTPSFVSMPGSVTVDVGDPFSIAAPAVGAGPITYQWFKGAEALAGKTSATLEIPDATINDQGIYHSVATNFYGSAQIADVNVTVRVPDRVLTIDSPAASEENRTLDVPIYLDSAGDVTGLTIVLPYNLDLLRNPSFIFGPHLSLANSSVVVNNVAGTVRVVGSAFPSTIPAGRQRIGTFRFTTRSVPANASVTFAPTLSSISDLFGSPLGGYTKMGTGVTALAQRVIPGDANNNGRLDVSDAAELIRLYANPAQIRTWDHYLNDLNLDTILTEGDATRVLRVVANLDETPSFPEAIAPMMAPMMMAMASPSSLSTVSSSSLKGASVKMTSTMSMNSFSLAPAAARLVLTRLTGANANKVLAQVYLDNVPAGQAGVSFQVDYPASVLRVAEASSLIIPSGGLPTGVAPTWNVSPGNAYAAQTGSLTLAAAWGSSWTFANGQAVANIVFEVNPAVTGQVNFPLTLAATEVAPYNADGPSTPLSVPGHVVVFNRTYADWALATLGNAAAGSSLDPDGDGMSNALEYAASTNPNDPNSRLQTTSAAMTVNGYRLRWFAAYGVSYKVRWSSDLKTWNDLTTPDIGIGAETEVADPAPPAGSRFYRVEVVQ